MIRSLAALLGFMFFVSALYYISFWGRFDIDIFQYIQVSDIIKGVVYPFRDIVGQLVWYFFNLSIALSVTLSEANKMAFVAKKHALSHAKEELNRLRTVMLFAFGIAFLFASVYYIILYSGPIKYGLVSAGFALPLISLAFTLAYIVVDYKSLINKGKAAIYKRSKKNNLLVLLDYATVFLIVYLVVAAYGLGITHYRKIVNHISYDCVQNTAFLNQEGMRSNNDIIYLGAVSDKYIFWEDGTKNHFVIDKYKIPLLYLAHYNVVDEDADFSEIVVVIWYYLVCNIIIVVPLIDLLLSYLMCYLQRRNKKKEQEQLFVLGLLFYKYMASEYTI